MSNEQSTTTEANFTDAATFSGSSLPTMEVVSVNKSELFTIEQCKQIMSECVDELWIPTSVVGHENFHKATRQKLRGDTQGFPFGNIRDVTKEANSSIFDFNLLGIIDQDYPQVFRYSAGDFYNMHIELTPMAPSRKITFIVNLSDPNDYKGGNIEFLNIDADPSMLNEQGSCLIFPSFMPFKINEVTEGNKCIIIGHVHGAIFK